MKAITEQKAGKLVFAGRQAVGTGIRGPAAFSKASCGRVTANVGCKLGRRCLLGVQDSSRRPSSGLRREWCEQEQSEGSRQKRYGLLRTLKWFQEFRGNLHHGCRAWTCRWLIRKSRFEDQRYGNESTSRGGFVRVTRISLCSAGLLGARVASRRCEVLSMRSNLMRAVRGCRRRCKSQRKRDKGSGRLVSDSRSIAWTFTKNVRQIGSGATRS